jgi:hypothetical protein
MIFMKYYLDLKYLRNLSLTQENSIFLPTMEYVQSL